MFRNGISSLVGTKLYQIKQIKLKIFRSKVSRREDDSAIPRQAEAEVSVAAEGDQLLVVRRVWTG